MSNMIGEKYRVVMPLVGQSISNTNVTGTYHSIAGITRVLAIMAGGAAAATKTFTLDILEATSIAGAGAGSVDSAVGTANIKVKKVTVALASTGTGDTVTVTTYTGATVIDTGTFTQGSTDAAAGTFANAAGLVLCIAYAFTTCLSVASTTNVLIDAYDGYSITVSSTNSGGTITVATNESVVIVDLSREDFAATTTHIAPKVTTTGVGIMSVVFVIETRNLPVTQSVAAS